MKKLLTFLLIGLNFVVNTSNAQTSPVAINDTFYVAFSDTLRPWNFTRTAIVANDTTKGGGFLKVDTTLYYNGLGSVSLIKNSLGLSSFTFTPPLGFFGLDSITYYLTNYPTNYGYDTAIIYIYVKRKDYENIDLNNVNAIIHKDVLFQNKESGTSGFEVPKGSGSNSIYAANFWFQGLDPGIQLKGYSETFVVNNQIGHAGPVMYDSLYENYSYQWDRVWKVNAIDIQNHISGSSTIEAITNWPAHGDTSKGQAQNLAPFVDVDFDGIYNPILGDYPKIKGQQAIYFIRNSDRSEQTLSNGSGSNLEFHGMVYVYDCSEDSAINNTVFIDYTIYNRSAFTLTNCYFGQWVDIDVGNSNDDYTACDVRRGTFYGYNGDGNDEPTNGDNGYGINLPAQGVTFLKGAKQDDDGNDNPLTTNIPTAMTQNGIPYTGLGIGFGDGTIDNEYFGLTNFTYYNIGTQINGNGSPVNGSDAYNYMKGKWANDNDIVWGGDGNPLGTGNPTLPSS
ncbi:MAG: Ig-like domain-containing protein, partial [Flavobacteriales bacterium]